MVKIQKFGIVWYEFEWFGHNSEAECWKRLCNPEQWMTHKGGHRAARAAKKWKSRKRLGKNWNKVEKNVEKELKNIWKKSWKIFEKKLKKS